MNDDEFGHSVFARDHEACLVDEPARLPDVAGIPGRARRRARVRRGLITGGTVALACVVTAGIALAPSFFSGDTPDRSSNAPAVASTTTAASTTTSGSPTTKPTPDGAQTGTPCTHQPLDLTAILRANLPTGITAAIDPGQSPNGVSCVEYPGGGWELQASYTLSTPSGILAIHVITGDHAVKDGSDSAAATNGLTPAEVSRLQELKQRRAAQVAPQTTPTSRTSPTAAAKKPGAPAASVPSSADSADSAAVKSAQAAKSAAARAAGQNGSETPVDCSTIATDTQVCSSEFTKGSARGTDVTLVRSTSSPLVIDVMAGVGGASSSTTGAASTAATHPPLTIGQLTTIAKAIAAGL